MSRAGDLAEFESVDRLFLATRTVTTSGSAGGKRSRDEQAVYIRQEQKSGSDRVGPCKGVGPEGEPRSLLKSSATQLLLFP